MDVPGFGFRLVAFLSLRPLSCGLQFLADVIMEHVRTFTDFVKNEERMVFGEYLQDFLSGEHTENRLTCLRHHNRQHAQQLQNKQGKIYCLVVG